MRCFRAVAGVMGVALVLCGCSARQFWATTGILGAGAAGAAAVYYARGDLEADLPRGLGSVFEVSLRVLQERGYRIAHRELNDDNAAIEARLADGEQEDIRINLRSRGLRATHLSIRVGIFGNEALSHAILDDIEGRL